MHYKVADDAFFAILSEHSTDLISKLSATAFPKSYRAMLMFCMKANNLKCGMFDCVDSNNPYAFQVLFRCFCEHYLKFTYIWARFLQERNDVAGVEYYSFCGASEAKEYLSAIVMAEGLLGNSLVADIESTIAKLYPEAAKLSAKELEKASGRFKYRAILRFLAKEDMQFVGKDRPFLAQIVPAYALLSSFVHGGPYTDLEAFEYSQPRALEDCESKAEVVFLMTASILMMTAMAISREYSEVGVVASKVKVVLDEFLGE